MNFDPKTAAQLCEDLSLARGIPQLLRDQARHQLYFQSARSDQIFPSWHSKRMSFIPPPGLRQMNPSVTRFGNSVLCLLRCTDYVIDDRGPRHAGGREGSRNFLLQIEPEDFTDSLISEVVLPKAIIEDALVGTRIDFEDARIFEYERELWAVASICFKNQEGWPEQWLGRIKNETLADLRQLKSPMQRKPEKNWIPFVDSLNRILFLYLCDPVIVIDRDSKIVIERYPRIDATHFRGSSQGLPFEGGLLVLVHMLTMHKGWPQNLHRFVWFNSEFDLVKLTDAFKFPPYFNEDYLNGYQYGMGLCWHPDQRRLLLSYSIGDGASFLATVESADIEKSLREV